MPAKRSPLLVGEIFVDVTLTPQGEENKLRMGGIAHAARGLWALDVPFSVAVVLPSYLNESARDFLSSLGCREFHTLGEVSGAPNVTLIADASEVADQGYDTLLRDAKSVHLTSLDLRESKYQDVLLFPGSYSLVEVAKRLPQDATLHLDVAYDLDDPALLGTLQQYVETIMISTSSRLFASLREQNVQGVANAFHANRSGTVILKENRGGTSMLVPSSQAMLLPAQLGTTVNSVGVGDVFAAAYVAHLDSGSLEAGWRATYAAAAYSQTTFPDLFRENVQRDLSLSLEEMQNLGGVTLPWEDRPALEIYLAAPDFTYVDRRSIERATASLSYHNFKVRRPVQEIGELPANASHSELVRTFRADYTLLRSCSLLFAVPTGRDPGTLVEIGLAIESGIPVVVYDPPGENNNTMVMAGADHYSNDLDSCLNATFRLLARTTSR